MASANIKVWIGIGRPTVKSWNRVSNSYTYRLPAPPAGYTGWGCDAKAELESSPADREKWYQLKSGCKSGAQAVSGLKFSPSLGGFVGSGVETPPDAVPVRYTPPPVVQSTAPAPSNVQPNGGTTVATMARPAVAQPSQGLIEGIVGGLSGFVTGGPAGAIVGAVSGLVGGGESATSPGVQSTGYGTPLTSGCPKGWYWDGTQCREGGVLGTIHQVLPGGQTGTMPATGYGGDWQTTNTPLGAGYVPHSVSQVRLSCPPGYVLVGNRNGRSPGMEVCLPKGIAGGNRKWKKPPRPVLTGGEKKVLTKAARLRNRVKKLAQDSGYTCHAKKGR